MPAQFLFTEQNKITHSCPGLLFLVSMPAIYNHTRHSGQLFFCTDVNFAATIAGKRDVRLFIWVCDLPDFSFTFTDRHVVVQGEIWVCQDFFFPKGFQLNIVQSAWVQIFEESRCQLNNIKPKQAAAFAVKRVKISLACLHPTPLPCDADGRWKIIFYSRSTPTNSRYADILPCFWLLQSSFHQALKIVAHKREKIKKLTRTARKKQSDNACVW